MKKFNTFVSSFLLTLLLFCPKLTFAQVVSEPAHPRQMDEVFISYELNASGDMRLSLGQRVTIHNPVTFVLPPVLPQTDNYIDFGDGKKTYIQ